MPPPSKILLDPSHDVWPVTEQEAVDRANLYEKHDPYPGKKSALLGSDDFLDYARVTGMIFPCEAVDRATGNIVDQGRVKPASYEVRPGQKFFRYEESGQLTVIDLGEDKNKFIHLPPNSITFVSTNERFRLPHYIAMRFNLRIQHVHRGLLLGTGPLVDPGYGEKILIPLHNLTDEDYYIPTSKGLIWVEFTKTSWTKPRSPTASNRHNVDLPANTEKELKQFLVHANQGRPIRSSIPKAVVEAGLAVARSERRAQQLEQQIRAISIVGVLALILTLAGVLIPILSLIQDTGSVATETQEKSEKMIRRIDALEQEAARASRLREAAKGSTLEEEK